MFDELTDDELEGAAAAVAAAGLSAARLAAATRLAAGPASSVGRPAVLVTLLMDRDETSPAWDWLGPYEQRWAVLVVRIVAAARMDPLQAVADARRRGTSWAAIGRALGVTMQTAHGRFAERVRGM